MKIQSLMTQNNVSFSVGDSTERGKRGVIDLVEKQKIILRHRDGDSNRQIAADLDIDKNTVNKYVNEYEEAMAKLLASDSEASAEQLPPEILIKPKYDVSNRGRRESTEEAITAIKECLDENTRRRQTGRSKQQMRKIEIYDYLKKRGYKISYSTVKRVIADIKKESEEAYIKQEYKPGVQTEFDWGEVTLDIGGTGYMRYQMAVFSSAYGNHRFARLYRTQDTAAFQESHVDYFAFCGGVFHTVVYDNMKVAVKTFVGPSEKEPTDALLEMSIYYGFDFRFCNVRRGNEKSHVERSVDVVRHFAFTEPGDDCFETLEAANEHLLKKCMEKNASPLSDNRIPDECFIEEKANLMPLPPKMPCFIKRVNLKVDKFSTVTANRVHYSVPDKYVGKRLDARIYTGFVEIYDGSEKVARHERHYGRGEYVIDIFHYLKTLKRKPGALSQSTALLQADTRIKNIYETYYTDNAKEFLPVLELIDELGVETVEKAINRLSEIVINDYSADKIRLIYEHEFNTELPQDKPYGTDKLSEKSRQTLTQYDMLRDLQTRRAC